MTRLLNQLLVPAKVAGFLSVLILLLMACTPTEAALIQGILQDVDSANGEITIVTREGKTITLTISSDDIVNADGATSSFDSLVPGVSIEADVAGGQQVSGKVRILQAEDEGSSEDDEASEDEGSSEDQGSSEDEGDGAHDEASEDEGSSEDEGDGAHDEASEDEGSSEDEGDGAHDEASEDEGSSEDEGDGAHDEASEDEEDSADDVADEDEKGSEDDGS